MKKVKLYTRGMLLVDRAEISKDEKYYTFYIDGDYITKIVIAMRHIQSIVPYDPFSESNK